MILPVAHEVWKDGGRVTLGVAGLYGWGARFEEILQAVAARLSELGASENARFVRFPPVISRATIDRVRYREVFPHLLGEVTVWDGASDTNATYQPSPMVLTPAACYHVYPLGSKLQDAHGESFEVESWCFRNEAGQGAARLCAFRMREFVKVGDPASVYDWRGAWVQRALEFARALGLEARVELASDPFFGAQGRLLAGRQRAQEEKYELLAPVERGSMTAVASLNYHHALFGSLFEMRLQSGDPAHTACAAFGLERLTAALVLKHGEELSAWPRRVRDALTG